MYETRLVPIATCMFIGVAGLIAGPIAGTQDERPAAAPPQGMVVPDQDEDGDDNGFPAGIGDFQRNGDITGSRRESNGELGYYNFDDVGVLETIPFISRVTGKVVIPVQPNLLRTQKVTVVSGDRPITDHEALDLLFHAFRLNGVGVIEREDVIILTSLQAVGDVDLEVLNAEADVMQRKDLGTIVIKIFKVTEVAAELVEEQVSEILPDYATLSYDVNSNQLILRGDIAIAQTVQKIIRELDELHVSGETRTFILKYADAGEIADNILDLFESDGQPGTGRSSRRQNAQRGAAAQQTPAGSSPGPTVELRLTVNPQRNALTIFAEPRIVREIDRLINTYWDLPRPLGTAKVYHLEYTDPLKIRDILREILGEGVGGSGGGARRPGTPGGGAGGRSDVEQLVGGLYTFEAFADTNSLIALSKTEDTLEYLDNLITQLDQPSEAGLPLVIPLKHGDAVEIAEVVNVLLAPQGSRATLAGRDEGLTAEMQEGGGVTTGDGGAGEAGRIEFPWQTSRGDEELSDPSPLIGKARIVPVIRQNALAVVAPPAKRHEIEQLVHQLDQPGRQVLISAVIAEIELTDDLELGFRFSDSDQIFGGLADYRLSAGNTFEGENENIFGDLFDTSVLTTTFNVNLALQALQRETNVRILQQPEVFTADNEEAVFFDGQRVPIITGSNVTPQGGTTQQFDQEDVGVFLNVRPRITEDNNVDLDVNLVISSVIGSVSELTVLDRRQTTTKVILRNGQTIVVSGLMRDDESFTVRKIPLLGDIPLLGELFKSRQHNSVRTELLVFITPHVVENPEDNDSNFMEEDRQRLKEIAQPLNEQRKRRSNLGEDIQEQFERQAEQRPVEDETTPLDLDRRRNGDLDQ